MIGALFLSVLPWLSPIANPDIFWHLSSARWVLENRALPWQDYFSFTRQGLPWIDFEWLSQLVFYAAHAVAGYWGLWLLKVALLAACAGTTFALLKLYGLELEWRLAGLAIWSAGAITFSDIRPDLISLLFFSIQLVVLEAWRLEKLRFRPAFLAGFFALYVLWNNLHAGFAQGLALWAAYIASALLHRGREPGRLAVCAAASAAGTLVNPYGLGPYRVLAEHWRMRADLTRIIQEWQPIPFQNPFHWPFWPVLVACLVLVWRRAGKKDLPLGLVAAALGLGYGAASHARLSTYFNAAVVPLIFILARDLGWLTRRGLRVLGAAGLVYSAYLGWAVSRLSWARVLDGRHVPVAAGEWMARENQALKGLKTYNPWEWGGYLGWRLGPDHKVFADGRYIFHDLLDEIYAAIGEAGKCQAFFARYGVGAAILRNTDVRFPTTKIYPDGSKKAFMRPWYLFYMPREQWALVYWDRKALVFVDRRRVDPRWLKNREYRYVRPGDDEAFAEAMERKEIPRRRVEEEMRRHAQGS